MKINTIILLGISIVFGNSLKAQQKTSLKLEDAIQLAWKNSNETTLADTKVKTKELEVNSLKNQQYPDFKVSAQYQRLANASFDLKQSGSSSGSTAALPVVNQLILGQANASLPIFNGFKLRNSIQSSQNLVLAESANALQTKENVAMKVVNYYAHLYKAKKTVELLTENIKSAQQRVVDFTDLEKNGIIPRNDLLKAQLQLSKLQLSLDSAKSDWNTVNFELVTFLKLDSKTNLDIIESEFANLQMNDTPTDEQVALSNRKDLESLNMVEKASLDQIKVAKSGYYPSLALIGGYTTLDLKNVVTVQNAINFGLGISYDLSNILKNGNQVKLAQNRAQEVKESKAILQDQIKMDVQRAIEAYDLSLKQGIVYNQAIEQATENYRILKDKYDNGLADTNDLLEADIEQLGAKINQTLSRANSIQKYYALLSVSGQLNQKFNLSKI